MYKNCSTSLWPCCGLLIQHKKFLGVFDIIKGRNVEVAHHYLVKDPREASSLVKSDEENFIHKNKRSPSRCYCACSLRMFFLFFVVVQGWLQGQKKPQRKILREFSSESFSSREKKNQCSKNEIKLFFPFLNFSTTFFLSVWNWKNFSQKIASRNSSEAFFRRVRAESKSYRSGRQYISNTCKRG